MKKKLVTSALPYVNNVPHLGNLIQVLSADVFARFCRLRGYETLYVCGTDEYGTATETRALMEGVSPRELCDRYHAIHRDIYKWFGIEFDHFGRTSSPTQTKIVQAIFKKVDENGYIVEKESEQLYCPHCQRFLADRFVVGTCPKCGATDARGDQCDACQTLLDPTDLVDPRCQICGATPVLRKTRHLYLDLPKVRPLLEKWKDEASERGFWAKNALSVTDGWIRGGLKERCITRDLKWGIPVPRKGYEDKVFYVWFDAPIGYVSLTADCVDDWQRWWRDPEGTELFQFIGKDNIPFHTVIFPATQLATGEKWTMLHHMSSSEYLNYEGGKFSKSRGVGIFGNDVQSTGIPADVWRFYLFYNRPERADVNFTWKDFGENVNSELVGNLSNLANRTLSFVQRFYGGSLGEGEFDEDLMAQFAAREERITSLMEAAEERSAFRALFALSSVGNKAFQDGEPWRTRVSDPEAAGRLLRTLLSLVRDLAVMAVPFIPAAGRRLLASLGCPQAGWSSLGSRAPIRLGEVSHLFERLDQSVLDALKKRFSGVQEGGGAQGGVQKSQSAPSGGRVEKEDKKMSNDVNWEELPMAERFARRVTLRVARIDEVVRHPNGDMLYILTLDTGAEEKRTIVSSIVPYYTPDQLLGRNIVLVENLKPANFRGVKSRGMLLAASDPDAEPHTTCDVLFAPQFPVGTKLAPEGLESPDGKCYVKADAFFSMPLRAEDGILKVDGTPIGAGGVSVVSERYKNGPVG